MTTPQGRFLEGKKVLLAYEGKLTFDLLYSALKQCGASNIVSGSPQHLLVRLKDFKPDIIVCEYAMEQVHGAAFIGFIRKQMKITAPAIMLIHRGDSEAVARTRACGAEQTVMIPFATIDIMKALEKISGAEVKPVKTELYFGE